MSSVDPSGRVRLIAVDERLVAPESRYEVLDGRVEYVAPADEEHGSRHSKVSALLEAYACEDYDVASDMLTRTSERDDVAPDVSVFPRDRHPDTGGRQIEDLAFEVVTTERLASTGEKAKKLSARGVRRVFAVDTSRQRAFEWSRAVGSWQILGPGTRIEDPTLALPLPVDALVHAAKADDAVAQALLAKRNPIIEAVLEANSHRAKAEGKAQGKAEGRAEAKAEAVLAVLCGRGLTPNEELSARILATRDVTTLDDWLARVGTCSSAAALLSPRHSH